MQMCSRHGGGKSCQARGRVSTLLVIVKEPTYLEWQSSILVEANRGGDRVRVCAGDGSEVRRVLSKVDECGVGHRLGTTRVRNGDELLDENRVLVMVPVAEDDSKFLVVRDLLLWRVNDYRSAKAVDVLTLAQTSLTVGDREISVFTHRCMRVYPVRSVLATSRDWDSVIKGLANWDTTRV